MDLRGPRAKLDWALEHLERLNVGLDEFLEAKPFRVVPEFDDDAGCYVLRLRLRQDGSSFRLGLMVGDLIHNARSALDQAVWLIACRSNPIESLWKPDTAWKIAFPILKDRSRFSTHKVMPFIADDAKAVLDSLQPYNGGDTPEALGRLDALWNIDKHRVIHKSVAQLDITKISFRPASIDPFRDMPEGFPKTSWSELSSPIEDGAEIGRVRFRDGRGPPETKVEMQGEPAALIAFGSGFFSLPIEGIENLLFHTGKTLSLIEALPDEALLLQR